MIGDKIRNLRTNAKMTQPELAEKLGVSRSAIASYENNSRQPSSQIIVKLSQIFNISTDYFLTDSKHETVDIGGLTNSQKKAVHDLIKAFKFANEQFKSPYIKCDDSDVDYLDVLYRTIPREK